MRPQLTKVLGNCDIKPTRNAFSQTQGGNCLFELGSDYGTGNRCVRKDNRLDQ